MEIIVAKTAGFCAGVRKAVETVYASAKECRVCTLGPITHNSTVTRELKNLGVNIIDRPDEAGDRKIIIRSHGVGPEVYSELELKELNYIDCTCGDVKKIHKLVENDVLEGRRIIILGQARHPEIIGINGVAGGKALIISSPEAIGEKILDKNSHYTLVSQTTFTRTDFDVIADKIKSLYPELDIRVNNTICNATVKRQEEAASIASSVDKMIVLGDSESSNSVKLYEICKKFCKIVYFVESIKDLQLKFFRKSDRIGITAGASTPPAIIKEALTLMEDMENIITESLEDSAAENLETSAAEPLGNDNAKAPGNSAVESVNMNTTTTTESKSAESFEEMLSENIISLHTGDIVKGTVIAVNNGEISVNLGYKSDGVIQRAEFSEDPDIEPADVVKPGDVLDVFVIRVNDVDGNVMLSKKKIDYFKNIKEVERAAETKEILSGKIMEVVKGGAIALINGLRAFVPSSQISNRFVEDIESFVGKELEFNILEYDKQKRKIIAGRKELASRQIEELKTKALDAVEIGRIVEGTVSRLVDFGAFIDLNGVDGLIHVSELSWNRVRRPSDVLKVGDKVRAYVMDINREKGKISLSIKNLTTDPWENAPEKYAVGTIVEGTVVRMTAFGAFVQLEEGIDGLLHISQISENRIQKPDEILSIGDVIKVKVTDLNMDEKRISLSKKQYDRQLARERTEMELLGLETTHEDDAGQCEGGICDVVFDSTAPSDFNMGIELSPKESAIISESALESPIEAVKSINETQNNDESVDYFFEKDNSEN